MKPDISFATKSGHFYLLTTLPGGRRSSSNPRKRLSMDRKSLDACFGGDKRPIFWNRTNVKSLDVAQVGDTLYYVSAGFLTFKQSEFTSCLSADRPLLKLECRVGARVSLVAGLSYLESIVRCRGRK